MNLRQVQYVLFQYQTQACIVGCLQKIIYSRSQRLSAIMRFGSSIRHLAIPEWKQCYLDYQHLKIFIRLIKKIVELIHACNQEIERLKNIQFDQAIMMVQTIQTPLQSCVNELLSLGQQANELYFDAHNKSMSINRLFLHMKLLQMRGFFNKCKAIHSLHLQNKQVGMLMQIVEYIYIQTSLVQSAKYLNLQGQRKILKKHMKYAQNYFETPRSRNKKVLRIKQELSKLLIDLQQFYVKNISGSSKKNRERLRQLAKKEESSNFDSFIFGSWIGICLCILGVLIAILSYTNKSIETDFVFNRDFPTWRGIALFFIFIWVLGLNVNGFQYYSISHRVIFQYNQHHYSTSTTIYKVAGFFSTFFLIMFAIYTLQIAEIITLNYVSPHYLVLFVWGLFILYLINPLPIFSFRSRLYALKIAVKSILAPFWGVTFPVIWMTDQLVTLITPFKDMAYTICYYMNITPDQNSVNSSSKICNSANRVEVVLVVGAIAYFFRIVQCIRQGYDKGSYFFQPQFFNTLKYSFSFITLILSFLWKAGNDTIFYAWVVFAAVSTLYSYIWDIKMDWALLQPNSPHRFLRKNLYYPFQAYYVIIVVNFLFRIVWVGTLSPSIANNAFGSPQIFSLVTGIIEIIRRGIWNMLRVQKQHITNCKNFKATPSMVNSLQDLIIESVKIRKVEQQQSLQIITNPPESTIETITKQYRHIKSKHLEHLYSIIETDMQAKGSRAEKGKKLKKKIQQVQKRILSYISKSSPIKLNKVTPMHDQDL